MNLSRESLEIYYKNNFILIKNFNCSLFDLENMICWERTIYLNLVKKYYSDLEKK